MNLYLPSELIELIASYLPNNQQYKCLFLCKSWYGPFHRSLYKVIQIDTRYQFKLLLPQLTNTGLLVRELYFMKSSNNSSKSRNKRVGITKKELDQLATLCPYMEILDFDQEIWKYIHYDTPKMMTEQFLFLHQLPTFTDTMNIPSNLQNLTRLSLEGKIVLDLFHQDKIFGVLSNTPKLKKLCLSSQQSKSHVIYITLNDMELMHQSLPLLEELEMNGSFKFTNSHTTTMPQITPCFTLHQLSILKATLPPHWIYYIAHKYPQLQDLDLEILNNDMYNSKPSSFEIIKKKEIQNLFSILLKSCPQLHKIEIDSASAKTYMTESFFDTADHHHHQLQEIKMKDLSYNLVSRENGFFDLLTKRGQRWISGLGTEVIGSDLHISNILNNLSMCMKLTELMLCCGHPYYDCELDLVLEHCPQLLDLTIRSAHLTLLSPKISTTMQQYPLNSLHLSTVSFSSPVFDYLGKTCHSLSTLSFYECDQRQPDVISIHMPFNNFDSIILNGIRLDSVPLEKWIPNVRILSVEQQGKEKRWYHAYNRNLCNSAKIQRLNHRKSTIAQQFHCWINNDQKHLEQDTRARWEEDLLFGQISIKCQSVKHWEFICNTTYNEF